MASRGYLSRRSRKGSSSTQKSTLKGQRKKKLPPWDSSISNLLVHKPTKEELRRRHELHQPVQRFSSSPTSSIQFQPSRVTPGSDLETFTTPESTRGAHFSVLREIMNTNEKLQKALTYSDKKMSAIPDLFGDDPKKYRGFPNITCAPVHKQTDDSERLRKPAFMKEPSLGASNLDILSETVMDRTALNDASDLYPNTDVNNNEVTSNRNSTSQYPVNTSPTGCNSVPSSTSSTLPTGTSPEIQEKSSWDNAESYDVVDTEEKISHEGKMEDGQKENQGKKASVKANTVSHSTAPALKGLLDLREMIDTLEEEVRKFEVETGREQTSMSFCMKEKESFGGFTVSILHAITKLVGYLRECERQRKTDLTFKNDMFLTFQQQQMLIDALTNEVICLQEENRKLRENLETSKETTAQELKHIKRELYSVLKSREYETLSSEMDFLYDRVTPTGQQILQDVAHEHGIRDNFEYLFARTEDDCVKVPEQAGTNNETHYVKTDSAPDTRTINEKTPETFQNDSKTTASVTDHTSPHTGSLHNSQATEPSDRISPLNEQEKIPESSPLASNQPFLFNPETDAVPAPNTSLNTSAVFTYYNPVLTNTLDGKEENLTSPASCSSDKNLHEDLQRASVFIRRSQTTSPHRRSKPDDSPTNDLTATSHFKISPGVSPVLFDRQLLPERPGQEKVIVRLPSMWQDSQTGVQRNTPTANFTKPSLKQKSDNGWFALSSHVDMR